MTALPDACADVSEWLPRAAALIAEPDTDGSAVHGKAGSRPPWNQASANSVHDTIAVIADTLAVFRLLVTGRPGPRPPYAATGSTLALIGRLSHAVPQDRARQAARELARCAVVIQQLPAIDEAERSQKITWPCPYCHFAMMRVYPRSGRVACLRGGFACLDADGNAPAGRTEVGRLGPCVIWNDGLVS